MPPHLRNASIAVDGQLGYGKGYVHASLPGGDRISLLSDALRGQRLHQPSGAGCDRPNGSPGCGARCLVRWVSSRPDVFRCRALVAVLLLGALLPTPAALAVEPDAPRAVRTVLYPIKLKGERVPSHARLEQALRGLSRTIARFTYGRIQVSGEVAPTFSAATRATAGNIIPPETLSAAVSAGTAAGVIGNGAIPVFLAPSRVEKKSFSNGYYAVVQGHGLQRSAATVAHEFGHMLGLDHAVAPRACPRPFRPVTCATHPRGIDPYGDMFDVMGYGLDRFGAYQLAALGVAPVLDAPAGRARVTVRPLQVRDPTLLRLRTAGADWFVESRTVVATRDTVRSLRLPAGVVVSRVEPRYVPKDGLYPQPLRVPASSPERVCRAGRDCLKRQLFRRGRTLTVPGAFRLRVLGRGAAGSTRVQTTWLDRSPPQLTLLDASILHRFGGGTELRARIGTSATGAGVAAVVIDQSGAVTRIDPDDVPGLIAGTSGEGVIALPLVPGATTATVRLVDAAGNESAPVTLDIPVLRSEAGASVSFDPPAGTDETRATQLPAGQTVTVRGLTDPAFAGSVVHVTVIGTDVSLDVPIEPDGSFTAAWTASAPGLYKIVADVPVERIPDALELPHRVLRGPRTRLSCTPVRGCAAQDGRGPRARTRGADDALAAAQQLVVAAPNKRLITSTAATCWSSRPRFGGRQVRRIACRRSGSLLRVIVFHGADRSICVEQQGCPRFPSFQPVRGRVLELEFDLPTGCEPHVRKLAR